MKTFLLCSILLVVAFTLDNCAYQYRTTAGVYFTSGSTSSGGLMRILKDDSVEPSGKVIPLPLSAGSLRLRYDPPYKEGRYVSMMEWCVDRQSCQWRDANWVFTFGNPADGDHEVRLVVYWVYAGDRHSAGADTVLITVKTRRDVW